MLLLNAWIERDKYQTPLPRKYSYLEPTDVVAVRGIARRFTNKEEQGYTHIVFDGVAAVTSVFVSAPMAVPPLGFVSQPVPVLNSTDVLLLDTPLVMDTDSEVGFNAAMAGRKAGLWPSAVLMKSIDGGANYASVLSTGTPSTFGVATTVLGDFLGGNIFDELNSVQVRLTAGSGELSSSNRLGVINGANMAILGSELLQFRNAELLAVSGDTKSYRLSGLLRGRRGTEWAINTHYTEDNFVLLPVNNIEGAYAEIGLERLYKGVTSGQTLSSAQTIPFTNTGIALKEYAPVHLGGGRNAAGDIILDWIPRARKHGAWINGADVPVADLPYNFFVRIYTDNTYTDSAFDALALSAETYTYTTEAQTIDFGSPQSTLYWGVAAIASAGLGYFAQGVT